MQKEIQKIPSIPNNPWENQIKVTLNGGKEELESAIVPFTFGFGKDFIEKNPTHVLIIDRTFAEASIEQFWSKNSYSTHRGKRYFIDLSNPGDCFIEFFKSGLHNLIFMFYNFEEISKKEIEMRKAIFLEKSSVYKNVYEYTIYNTGLFSEKNNFIGFYEKNVSIPSEFFSILPKSGFKKIFFDWVNQWRRDKPVDECDFRDRVLRALTYELIPRILWFFIRHVLYFMLRFAVSVGMTVVLASLKIIFLIFGIQFEKLTSGFKFIWCDFLLKDKNFDDIIKNTNFENTYGYKNFSIVEGKKFSVPISLGGVIIFIYFIIFFIQSCLSINFYQIGFSLICIIMQFCFILETTKFVSKNRDKKIFKLNYSLDWKTKYDLYTKISFISASFILILEFLYATNFFRLFSHFFILIFSILLFFYVTIVFVIKNKIFVSEIKNKFSLFIDKFFNYFDKKEKLNYKSWLSENYSIEKIPDTVNASTLPKANTAKGRIIQTFKSKFWDTKAKVCKPYES